MFDRVLITPIKPFITKPFFSVKLFFPVKEHENFNVNNYESS